MLVRAWTYIRTLGAAGLREVSETAVLNANYLRVKLQGTYPPAYDRICMHETVLRGQISEAPDAHTLDIAKRLIDYGFHAPTMSFPVAGTNAVTVPQIVANPLVLSVTEIETPLPKRSKETFKQRLAHNSIVADPVIETPAAIGIVWPPMVIEPSVVAVAGT